ncbi:MAG: hypothetical protein ACRENP_26855 [Longimicrobiales bacterium]
MKKTPAKRIRVGTVVEIRTPRGLAYAQQTHHLPMFGSLLCVFPGVHSQRPVDIGRVLAQAPQFSTFFPLQEAVSRGIVEIVTDFPVAADLKHLPTFRVGMPDLRTGEIRSWWFWDGQREWPVGQLTPEQRKMPIREVVNDTLLIERICTGWRSETDQD